MRPPKFNFVPERQLIETYRTKDPFFTASIYPNGQLVFNNDYTKVYELNQKFIRFFIDKEKRTIGWKFVEGTTNLDELKDARQLIASDKGIIKTSITSVLRLVGWEKGQSFKKLSIGTYKSEGEINYIELPDKYYEKALS